MMLQNQMKNPNALMRIGLVFLLLGNISHYFLQPTARLGQGLVDGAFGLFLGISIGCLLLSVRVRGRKA